MKTIRLLAAAFACAIVATTAHADPQPVRIAQQYGISYLPLLVMKDSKLLEQEGKARGLDLAVDYITLSNGGTINDALISGNLEFASGGVGPMLTIWGKAKALRVKGVAGLNVMPVWLTTRNPAVTTIADFTEKDRIALPAVKVTIQAVVLQMAAAKLFGQAQFDRLDSLTTSLGHPDAFAALMSFKSEINAHFTSAPYMYEELEDKRVHRVLNSYDVLGGPHTFNAVWATGKYHDANPKVIAAFIAALDRAEKQIVADPMAAAAVWIKAENAKIPQEKVAKMIMLPENEWTITPKKTLEFANFMQSVGAVPTRPESWKDLFFPEIHDLPGG
jgi:NitT/TauT family transport system substrate-binding protein